MSCCYHEVVHEHEAELGQQRRVEHEEGLHAVLGEVHLKHKREHIRHAVARPRRQYLRKGKRALFIKPLHRWRAQLSPARQKRRFGTPSRPTTRSRVVVAPRRYGSDGWAADCGFGAKSRLTFYYVPSYVFASAALFGRRRNTDCRDAFSRGGRSY
eukprot:4030624-Pyramimonas_sp.AAC.1